MFTSNKKIIIFLGVAIILTVGFLAWLWWPKQPVGDVTNNTPAFVPIRTTGLNTNNQVIKAQPADPNLAKTELAMAFAQRFGTHSPDMLDRLEQLKAYSAPEFLEKLIIEKNNRDAYFTRALSAQIKNSTETQAVVEVKTQQQVTSMGGQIKTLYPILKVTEQKANGIWLVIAAEWQN